MARNRPTVWQTKAEVSQKSLEAANQQISKLELAVVERDREIKSLRQQLEVPLWAELANFQNGDLQVIVHRGEKPRGNVGLGFQAQIGSNGQELRNGR